MAEEVRKRVVLWDIDRTLIEARGMGRTVYERVFPEVVGTPLRELATVARERAARRLGTPIPAEHVVLIGDTPADVNAALASGARIIAVPPGDYSVDELLAAGAASPLETLDPPRLWQALDNAFRTESAQRPESR